MSRVYEITVFESVGGEVLEMGTFDFQVEWVGVGVELEEMRVLKVLELDTKAGTASVEVEFLDLVE